MTNDSNYSEESDATLKRDRHTCQLCGTVGYPKTEHGLAAVPVEPDDYRVRNLVTVCHECLKKDDQQLREEIFAAKARRQRRTRNQDASRTFHNDRDTTSSIRTRLREAIGTAKTGFRSLLPNRQTAEEQSDELIHRVARRDNYNCQVCHNIVTPRGRVGYLIDSVDPQKDAEDLVDNNITVCWDCGEWKDIEAVEQVTSQAIELKTASKGLSLKYVKASVREFIEKSRVFAHTGRGVILRRALISTVGLALLFTMSVVGAGLVGALFVSPETGIQWTQSVLTQYQTIESVLFARPEITLVGIAIGYAVHIYEQERAYEREVFRNERRRGETPSVSHGRPRWQFVAGFAAIGLFGALDWILVRHDVFPDGMLFGAIVFWMTGSAGVAYYLRQALREERDIDDYPVNPAPWVFASRYTLFAGLVGIAMSYLTIRSVLPPSILELTLVLAPLVGAMYVGRRMAERRTVWGIRAMYSIRTAIDTIWPLNDNWPPTEQNRQHPNPNDTDTE